MSKAKHTPGPWEVSDKDQMRVNVKTGSFLHPSEPRIATEEELEKYGDDCHDDWNICQCDDEFFMRPPKECEANARLIAAAPDLLEACKVALELFGEQSFAPLFGRKQRQESGSVREKLQSAIAKAKQG